MSSEMLIFFFASRDPEAEAMELHDSFSAKCILPTSISVNVADVIQLSISLKTVSFILFNPFYPGSSLDLP